MNQLLETRFPSAVDHTQAVEFLEDLLTDHTIVAKHLNGDYSNREVFLSYHLDLRLRDGTVLEDVVCPFGHYNILEPHVGEALIENFSLMDHIDRILNMWLDDRPGDY